MAKSILVLSYDFFHGFCNRIIFGAPNTSSHNASTYRQNIIKTSTSDHKESNFYIFVSTSNIVVDLGKGQSIGELTELPMATLLKLQEDHV